MTGIGNFIELLKTHYRTLLHYRDAIKFLFHSLIVAQHPRVYQDKNLGSAPGSILALFSPLVLYKVPALGPSIQFHSGNCIGPVWHCDILYRL